MVDEEILIDPSKLVFKKSPDFLKAVGITEAVMKTTHRKFIGIMQKECGVNNNCSAVGLQKFLEDLTILEQKAFIFCGMIELNNMTHELSKTIEQKKTIILPPKRIVKPK